MLQSMSFECGRHQNARLLHAMGLCSNTLYKENCTELYVDSLCFQSEGGLRLCWVLLVTVLETTSRIIAKA